MPKQPKSSKPAVRQGLQSTTSTYEPGARFKTPAFRRAARKFTTELWSSAYRRGLFTSAMQAIWQDFKGDDQYEDLRQMLSTAAKSYHAPKHSTTSTYVDRTDITVRG